MAQALTLKLKSLDPLKLEKPIELDIGKTILYGPNGSGKSAIIRVLAYLLVEDTNLLYESDYVNALAKLFGHADVQLCGNSECITLRSDGASFSLSGAKLGKSAARIVGDYIYSTARYKYMNPVQNVDDLRNILSNPTVAEAVERFLHHYYTELNIERFYGGYFKEIVNGKHEWRDIVLLPYGIKKAIAIIYALETYDVILIEGFESALHLDLMRALLDYMNEEYKDKIIVIETHSGLPLRWGIAKGWSVYRVERNNIVRLSKLEDLTNTELFKKELEALSL
jgi:energy-coupling factor transporter ATP-binding protein EcfA2